MYLPSRTRKPLDDLTLSRLPLPWGDVTVVTGLRGLVALHLGNPADLPRDAARVRESAQPHRRIHQELRAYSRGRLTAFSIPLDPQGTPFQHAVWDALTRIPYGETRSYGEIAAAIGRPGAARAVGAACHANPIGIIVPCHRVIGGNGALTGYAGGLDVKARLLAHERRRAIRSRAA